MFSEFFFFNCQYLIIRKCHINIQISNTFDNLNNQTSLNSYTASLCWAELLLSPSSCSSLFSSQAARPLLMVWGDGVGMGSGGRMLLPFITLCVLFSL